MKSRGQNEVAAQISDWRARCLNVATRIREKAAPLTIKLDHFSGYKNFHLSAAFSNWRYIQKCPKYKTWREQNL